MFGRKKKKQTDNENVESSDIQEQSSDDVIEEDFGDSKPAEEPEVDLEEQTERYNDLKSKLSQILKSKNIEIVDENLGDEYEGGTDSANKKDYDELKSLFGDGAKKGGELTLTIDDFDYTYVGQYLEEFDLLYVKNIKKVKFVRKYPKKLKKALLVSGIILVIGVGAFLTYYLTRKTPVYLKNVTLNQAENASYYVGDEFSYRGLYLIAEYSDGNKEKIKLDSSHLHDVTGKVNKVGDKIEFLSGPNAVLKFNYNGFFVDYTVLVSSVTISGLQAIFIDDLFSFKANEVINDDVLNLSGIYGERKFVNIPLNQSGVKIYVKTSSDANFRECAYTTNIGHILPVNLSQSSIIRIEYKSSDDVMNVLDLTYREGVNLIKNN